MFGNLLQNIGLPFIEEEIMMILKKRPFLKCGKPKYLCKSKPVGPGNGDFRPEFYL
jgi:hypothetical protein